MKNKTKILSIIAGGLAMIIGFSSCIKNRLPLETDLSHLQDHVGIIQGGITNFAQVSLGFNNGDTTTVTLIVNLESVNLPSTPVKVTIGVDAAKIDAFNSANGTSYVLAPTDIYSIASTTLTIPAGQQYAQTTVSFYKANVDPSVSYMLPISITDASGKLLTGNLNTIYYHIIGNPLAGNYLQDFYRWNGTTDTTTPPNSTVFTGEPIVVAPTSATDLAFPESYINTFAGGFVTLDFTNNSGTLANFSVFIDDATQSALDAGGFTVVTAPVLVGYNLVGDQSTHYAGSWFRTFAVLKNSAGGIRTVIDQFTKQP